MTDITQNRLITIGIILALVAVSFFVGRCSKQPDNVVRYVTKIDTAWKVQPAETLKVEGKGKIYYKEKEKLVYVGFLKDTCQPFVSQLDTIIKQDTLQARFEYPQNNFSILVRQKPDSTMIKTIYIETEPKIIKRSVWIDIASHTGTAAIGVIIGFIAGSLK